MNQDILIVIPIEREREKEREREVLFQVLWDHRHLSEYTFQWFDYQMSIVSFQIMKFPTFWIYRKSIRILHELHPENSLWYDSVH